MSDDKKPKPLDDLKEGLGLLFRAAKGAVEQLPTDKVEAVAKDAAKQVGKTFETIGSEMDKVWKRATGSEPPAPAPAAPAPEAKAADTEKKDDEEKKEEPRFDDAYAPEPPKGPRIG
jgi:hypothetical protein